MMISPIFQQRTKIFHGVAKILGQASRNFAAEAEKGGVAQLAQSGMSVITNVDRAQFAAAMASANPIFSQKFGADLIQQIRNYR